MKKFTKVLKLMYLIIVNYKSIEKEVCDVIDLLKRCLKKKE